MAATTLERSPLRIGIIGGSGLDDALSGETGETVFPDTPFGKPASPIVLTRWQGVDIAILKRHGPGHIYPPSRVPFRANIFALKMLGVTHILASGATGSLRDGFAPGDLVVASQVIDKTWKRESSFYDCAAVHVELAEPFCPVMRSWLLQAAGKLPDIRVHDGGCYVCMEGPAFSTRAESHLHRLWGGDLIGMTVMPEAKLAREAEIAYALLALPTDYDCWRPHAGSQEELLATIIGNLQKATGNGIRLIKAALSNVAALATPSPAHDALKLAIWSDKSKIDPAAVKALAPLWGRYFPQAQPVGSAGH